MSESPNLQTWPENIAAARIPANNNSRMLQAYILSSVISATTMAQPTPTPDPDAPPPVYIIPASATGAQWSGFDEGDVAIYFADTWTAFKPFEGLRKTVLDQGADGEDWQYLAGVWAPAAGGGGGGDFTGPGSSTDNALVRFDGTTGKTGQGSGVIVSDDNEISGYKGNINTQTGTSYTLLASDSGKIVELTNASAIALTAAPGLPKGFCCTIVQGGAGVATVASSGSGSVVNRQSQFKTAGANAMCTLYVRSNSGSNAVFVFGGDTSA